MVLMYSCTYCSLRVGYQEFKTTNVTGVRAPLSDLLQQHPSHNTGFYLFLESAYENHNWSCLAKYEMYRYNLYVLRLTFI